MLFYFVYYVQMKEWSLQWWINTSTVRPPRGWIRKKAVIMAALVLLLGVWKVSAQAVDTVKSSLHTALANSGWFNDSLEEHMDTWFGWSHTDYNKSLKNTFIDHIPKREVEENINDELAHNWSGWSINLKWLWGNYGSNTLIDLKYNNHKTGKGLKLWDALPEDMKTKRLTSEEVREMTLALIANGLTDPYESDITKRNTNMKKWTRYGK